MPNVVRAILSNRFSAALTRFSFQSPSPIPRLAILSSIAFFEAMAFSSVSRLTLFSNSDSSRCLAASSRVSKSLSSTVRAISSNFLSAASTRSSFHAPSIPSSRMNRYRSFLEAIAASSVSRLIFDSNSDNSRCLAASSRVSNIRSSTVLAFSSKARSFPSISSSLALGSK